MTGTGAGDSRGDPGRPHRRARAGWREGDDDRWDDIASDGVEVVVGGATWELWLGKGGWTASRPTCESAIGSAAFGEGDLIGTVGPVTLSAEEIVRRIEELGFQELTEN